MFKHNLTVSVRNLIKYKVQTWVSILGLAIGFVCFSLSMLWMRHEATYDSFHPCADRTYLLAQQSFIHAKVREWVPMRHAELLKDNFPEVEETTAFLSYKLHDESQKEYTFLRVDTSFFSVFPTELLKGSWTFLRDKQQIALSENEAMERFGHTDVIGKEMSVDKDLYTIGAVLKDWNGHSNYPLEVVRCDIEKASWYASMYKVAVRLKKQTDKETLQQKYRKFKTDRDYTKDIFFIPLTECRYTLFSTETDIDFTYLRLFSAVGLLIIITTLINYFSFYITRLSIRSREFAIRRVCGTSLGSLLQLLLTEFVIMLVCAGGLGMVFIELIQPLFKELTSIQGNVIPQALLFFGWVAIIGMLLFIGVTLGLKRRSLQYHLKKSPSRNRFLFQKINLVLQLGGSFFLIFCVCILMKQLNFLVTTGEVGWIRENRASLFVPKSDTTEVISKLKQIPEIKRVIPEGVALLGNISSGSIGIFNWDGKDETSEKYTSVEFIPGNKEWLDFWGIQLLEGTDSISENTVVINETAVKAFGWTEGVGKHIDEFTIVGVVKDFHKTAPTVPMIPVMIALNHNRLTINCMILMEYESGTWPVVRKKIERILSESQIEGRMLNMEEEYQKFLKSEHLLQSILNIAAGVCILVSIFCVYSLVTLVCEQRRKEIAIRKVNGATARDIVYSFVKEYVGWILLSAALGLPLGYVAVRRWLDTYVEQTAIDAWIYMLIVMVMTIVVLLSMLTQVWKAARQNPAEVIKTE